MELHKVILGKGAPVVLLHGFGFSSYIWRTLAVELEPDYQLILLDLPGCGHSPAGSYDLSKLSSLLVKTIATPAVWVGWSMGGLIASAVARRYPQRVRKLITVSCNPMFTAQPDWPGAVAHEFAQFCRLAQEQPTELLKQFIRLQCLGEAQQRSKIRSLTNLVQQSPKISSSTLISGLQLLANYDARPVWQQLEMPQLHIFGDIDQLVPHAVAGQVQQLLRHQQVVSLTDCGHQPFNAQPELFGQTMRTFIDERSFVETAHCHAF